mmetsp:Transcript_1869/g.5984  ORF Transcript_1869/g.5984 Transcript_1869/m.5984 type:complete len:211 (+) Transcript_1869:1877-2509(+)
MRSESSFEFDACAPNNASTCLSKAPLASADSIRAARARTSGSNDSMYALNECNCGSTHVRVPAASSTMQNSSFLLPASTFPCAMSFSRLRNRGRARKLSVLFKPLLLLDGGAIDSALFPRFSSSSFSSSIKAVVFSENNRSTLYLFSTRRKKYPYAADLWYTCANTTFGIYFSKFSGFNPPFVETLLKTPIKCLFKISSEPAGKNSDDNT